jgi:lipopolysaccharide cholinephosphotransferase
LEILVELDRVCRKNGIHYSLFMGTLLGAVRHQGFIPWDDDLDVAMQRRHYDAFAEACKRDLDQSRFFFQDHHTDPHYRWGYARIRRKDTEFVRLGQEHMKMRTGVFLDIFPIDSTPNFAPLRVAHGWCCFALRKILYAEVARKSAPNAASRAWFGLLSIVPHRWVLALLVRLSGDERRSRLVRILSFPLPAGRSGGYPQAWFDAYDEITFEGGSFPALQQRDAYLTFTYGDYMQLPPPEKRTLCHPAARISLLPSPEDTAQQP